MPTQVVFEHTFAIEGYVTKDFFRCAPAGLTLTGTMLSPAYNRAFKGDGNRPKTWIAFE